MIDIETTSLELSRRLHILELDTGYTFQWYKSYTKNDWGISYDMTGPSNVCLPAYTDADLWNVLPDYTELIRKNEEGSLYYCGLDSLFFMGKAGEYHWTWGDTPVEALGLMVEFLLKLEVI